NVTQSRGNTYGYGPDQRLASVLQGTSTIATYSYNPQGQRIAKTTGSSTTNFDYDWQGRLLEANDIPGNYVYLDGEPLARVDYNLSDLSGNVSAWNIAFYHNNPVGAPVQATDQNGNVSWTGQMDPFGSVLPINPNITQNLRFPGQYFDQETGLHYNMQRYYDPLNGGRYLQADRIGLLGGINTYAYAYNNPVNLIDPDGRIPVVGIALRLLAAFMPMIDLQMMAVDDVPGSGGGLSCPVTNKLASKVDDVIAETLAGKGDIKSKVTLNADELLKAGEQFLGNGYREIGKPGSGVFRSADDLRQFRIDDNSLLGNHAPSVPHGHLEVYDLGAAKPTVNNHIPFTE
ncbi:MAG: RHS repeat-associated core domain-containing protein, partial [Methylobacter sp.]